MSNALITGASQGFGRELTIALAREGWTVIAAGRDQRRLEQTKVLAVSGVMTLPGDVRSRAHQHALIAAARELGGLDLLVQNASDLGPSPLPSIARIDPGDFADILAVNVIAPLALTQLALPLLLRASAPTVVALSSDAGVEAYPGWGGYGSSKAALDQLMAVLAAEQPLESPLAVYSFDPGDMRTEMHQRAFAGEDISDRPEASTVVPALLTLLNRRPASGRYRAADLLAGISS